MVLELATSGLGTRRMLCTFQQHKPFVRSQIDQRDLEANELSSILIMQRSDSMWDCTDVVTILFGDWLHRRCIYSFWAPATSSIRHQQKLRVWSWDFIFANALLPHALRSLAQIKLSKFCC